MFERIKLLFPWYRELRKSQANAESLVRMLGREADEVSLLRDRNTRLARKLHDSDKHVHDYRKQLTDAGMAPKRVNSGEPVERTTPYPDAELPSGFGMAWEKPEGKRPIRMSLESMRDLYRRQNG